jgi:hypothetical protein
VPKAITSPVNAAPRPSRSSGDSEIGGQRRAIPDGSMRRVPIRLPPLLSRCANDAAQRWASAIRSRTLSEKRRPRGGWPGTLSEARFLVDEQLLPSLGVECLAELVVVDREHVARFLYRSARTWWTRLNRNVGKVE